jgi:hypothetical protein
MDHDTFLKELANAGFAIEDGPPDARLLLDEALAYLDEITRLRGELDAAPSLVVVSERGNQREHPALGALRAHRAALGKLLAQLFPPNDSPTTQRARAAANARWQGTRR